MGDDCQAVDVGQAEVEDHEIGRMYRDRADGGGPADGGAHRIAAIAEHEYEPAQQRWFVVDGEDSDHASARSRAETVASVAGGPGAAGSATTAVSPPPGVSSRVMVPRMALVNARAMARPSPTPAPSRAG